jgi:hypothetical protein
MAARMVAFENVMQAAANEFRNAYDTLDASDQKRSCKWMRKLRRGMTEGQVRRNAEKNLKPKAVDWDAIAAFIEKIMPLIISMISKV